MTPQPLTRHRIAAAVLAGLACGPLLAATATPAPAASAAVTMPEAAPPACPAILQKTFNRLQDDAPQNLCQYAGKVILVVNTASYCGFTSQYEGLEKMYAQLGPKGLVILGFPSNDFAQEPDSDKKIAEFCFNTYGVKFPMFAKSSVSGDNANPLYKDLVKATSTTPKWNFYKYLIDRKGNVVDSYSSLTGPSSSRLQGDIRQALAQK